MNAIEFIIVLAIVSILGAVGWDLYQHRHQQTFSLATAQWSCTANHTDYITTYIPVGKMLIPQEHPVVVCDQWTRKP